jgi:repressor LexA
MSKGLTQRQREVISFIDNFIHQYGYSPTIKEIADHFKISLKAGFDHVKALEKKKYISYQPKKSRSINVLIYTDSDHIKGSIQNDHLVEVPILGTVQAGLPIMSIENFEGNIKLDKKIFGSGQMFGVNIRGDSMSDEGIVEGDLAIIQCRNHFENGEIIVVDTGNGITIKKGYKEKDHIRLEAANKNYSSIVTRQVRVIGKYVGLIRAYSKKIT